MKKTNPISFKLIVGGCLALSIALVITGVISITKTTDAATKVGRENTIKQAQQIAATMDMKLDLQGKLAAAFASGNQVRSVADKIKNSGLDASAAEIGALRKEMKKKYKTLDENILGIFVTDSEGLLYTGELASGKEYKGSNVFGRDYFQSAKSTGQAAVGEVVRSKSTGELIYVACAPVTSPSSGEFLGIFGISIKAESLTHLISNVKIGKTGYGFMMNRDGIANAHPNEEYILQRDFRKIPGMGPITREMMSGKNAFLQYELEGVQMVAGFATVPSKGWSIALTQDEAEFMETPYSIRNSLLAVTVIAILLVGMLLFLFIKKTSPAP